MCATALRSRAPSAPPAFGSESTRVASLPKPTSLAHVRWRPLAAHDLPVVAALEARIHAAPWSERNFRDALAAGYSARVGVRAERIVAYGVLMLGPGEAQLLNLSVVPEARRGGLGRTLLLQFMDVARQLGAEHLFLEVRVGNLGAIALYRAEGFAAIARRIEYYPADKRGGVREDALVMRCDLRRAAAPVI
jgi:[ribosomal protein S18]-alanine N-acetyltransferase